MTQFEAVARQLLATASVLLDQGRAVDRLSRPLTVAALIGLLLVPSIRGAPATMLMTIMGLVALAGMAEAYLAIRVDIDAALFRQLAASTGAPDLTALDAALLRLRLLPQAKAGRPALERIAGARRLLHGQAAALIVQIALILAGAALAAAAA